METEPVRLGKLVERIISAFGLHDKFHGWKIVNQWPEIVGPDIARHSRALRYSDGTLTIVVEKDVWRQELEMQREQILRQIRRVPGGDVVKRIVLRAGSFTENKHGEYNGGR